MVISKYPKYAIEVLKKEGPRAVSARTLQKVAKETNKLAARIDDSKQKKHKFISIVDERDVLAADRGRKMPAHKSTKPSKAVNWVISPPRTGGGHMNMFRFIEHLDSKGVTNNIYLYSTHDYMSPEEAAENVSAYAKLKNTKFFRYEKKKKFKPADAIFATGWETAYPVLNEVTSAKKFYFVQDFEPYFYPLGTEYILAENTYRFGFHGITAGQWLSQKLGGEYGMKCDSYDFGADLKLYSHTNNSKRKDVFFYARPVTERRAFYLGIMALELFHEMHPDYTIHLAGWDVSDYHVRFPYVNNKTLPLSELGELYNKCATGLVLSLTNMSLLPLELLSCGVIPVVNDGLNNRLVSNNPFIEYAGATPKEMAQRMSDLVTRKDLTKYAKQASASVKSADWQDAKDSFYAVMERELQWQSV